jgi:hypothetical protein
MTRVVILQSNYVPWRGYFDLMDDADVFIVYDQVQYTKSDWRNRNVLKTRAGKAWITVPVRRDGLATQIEDARIDWKAEWPARHRSMIMENYRTAPFLDEVSAAFQSVLDRRHDRLSALNVDLMAWVAGELSIKTRIVQSSSLASSGDRNERLVDLVRAVGGTRYLTGPAALSYLDLEAFGRAGIAVEVKAYDYAPYTQLWGGFEGAVSILDLMLNTGPDARAHLKSRSSVQLVA